MCRGANHIYRTDKKRSCFIFPFCSVAFINFLLLCKHIDVSFRNTLSYCIHIQNRIGPTVCTQLDFQYNRCDKIIQYIGLVKCFQCFSGFRVGTFYAEILQPVIYSDYKSLVVLLINNKCGQ